MTLMGTAKITQTEMACMHCGKPTLVLSVGRSTPRVTACEDCLQTMQAGTKPVFDEQDTWDRMVAAQLGVRDRADLEQVKPDVAREFLRRFTEQVQQNLTSDRPRSVWMLLLGPTGIGKSYAMAAAARACVELGLPDGKIVMGTEEKLLARHHQPGGDRSTAAEIFRGARLVVLDEFGRGQYPSWSGASPLLDFFDTMAPRSTVCGLIATNFHKVTSTGDGTALEDHLDPAVFSRLWSLIKSPGSNEPLVVPIGTHGLPDLRRT